MKMVWRSTIMDQQGRIFLPVALRKRGGLKAGPVEFDIQRDGTVIIRNVEMKKNG